MDRGWGGGRGRRGWRLGLWGMGRSDEGAVVCTSNCWLSVPFCFNRILAGFSIMSVLNAYYVELRDLSSR